METDIKLRIPEYVSLVMERLYTCGYEACVVGGCVRDALLGREPSDWDVATSALPDKMLEIFASESDNRSFRAIPTGIAHGTVTVISNGVPVEVTSYRVDGDYTDGRRPDSVRFTGSLTEDLARRDFTVNAMAFSPEQGLTDPYGGLSDLKKEIIRCVGSPEKRFSEDALRILRALRFASTLGFDIEPETTEAVIRLRGLLARISRERVSAELVKILSGKSAPLILIRFRDVIETILPELRESSDYSAAVKAVAGLIERNQKKAPTALLLSALMSEMHPEKVFPALNRLRFDKKTSVRVSTICSHLSVELYDKISVRCLCSEVGIDVAEDIISLGLIRAEISSKSAISPDCAKYISEIRKNNECVSLSGLTINGEDLLALGARPEAIGNILKTLLGSVISEEIPNEKCALVLLSKGIINAEKSSGNNKPIHGEAEA
jgi:tRNA nucleotidyltransferase (CCA-adding enzyme)